MRFEVSSHKSCEFKSNKVLYCVVYNYDPIKIFFVTKNSTPVNEVKYGKDY